MQTDHIFIFTATKGKIAERLIELGFTEGSSRIHPGQGTINRKFYFNNFFLELLWVINPAELNSELIRATKLNERANYNYNGNSPFGLCIENTIDTELLFADAHKYQPHFFPEGMVIDVLANSSNPTLPWTFRLPFKGPKAAPNEPTEHKNGIELLTLAEFEFKGIEQNDFLNHFINEEQISFKKSDRVHLTLTFDQQKQGLEKTIDELQLTIKY